MKNFSISQIVSCHICPVRYYLELSEKNREEPENYTIAKQISYHLGDDTQYGTKQEDEIWAEIKTVNPDIDDALYETYRTWSQACRGNTWRKASENDVKVSSKTYNLHGVIDRWFDSSPHIALIRMTTAPDTGVYNADRVRAALFSICARESLHTDADEIIIEYIPSGVHRICRVSPRDRREALAALKKAEKIAAGTVPMPRKTDRCNTCYLKERCIDAPKKLSDIIG